MSAERSEALKDTIHGKRGGAGGRSGCDTEVTAPAVGESGTRTDGRQPRHMHRLRQSVLFKRGGSEQPPKGRGERNRGCQKAGGGCQKAGALGAEHSVRLPFGKPRLPFGKPCVADGGERGGGGGGRG